MAPWFSEECRDSRREYITIRRREGRTSVAAKEAFERHREVCRHAKREFSSELPGMLKYKPKQFWGMLKKPTVSSQH